jgi:hypothetical protein
MPPLASPDEVVRPYETLGTHPDLVARLWDELPAELPVDCRVVFYGLPALMHPTTGIVFGFAGGTQTCALRIKHYPGVQISFDLDDIGPEWVFCGWFRGEEAWCRSAFGSAGSQGGSG